MNARTLNFRSIFILGLAITFAIVLFSRVPNVHAQDGNPPTPQPEIIGGAPATAGEWRWQVALITGTATGPNFWDDQFCGGSLIHPQWVLTAAHCITDGSGNIQAASTVDIVAGIYNLSTPAGGYQRQDVTQIIRHPSYNDSTFDNDLALLKLSSAVTIGGSGETATALVRLVPAGIGNLAGTNSWVTGWGKIQENPDQWPSQLYEVQLPIYANSVCNDANHWGGGITDNMLCAGSDSGGISSCYGDSGGPLVVPDGTGGWYLAGITSFGSTLGCGAAQTPAVFTRVSKYGTWINQSMGLSTTLISPSGAIGSNYNPTYSWNAVNTMTWYYLWVNGPSGKVFDKWYSAADAGCASGTGTCAVIPTTPVGGGNHTWWVQTYNAAGYGPWSSGMSFSTTIPTAPGAATLVSPNGAITDNNPTYTWNQVSGATYYYLYVNGPSGNVIKNWYTSAQASCSGGTCSVTPATELGGGNHTWWIQTYNSAGYGPWSSAMTFSLPVPTPPGAATLISPSGSISTSTPTYTWNEVLAEGTAESAATWYYLWVNGPSGNEIKQWYQASAICSGGTCSVTPSTSLAPGSHTWWVQTYNAAGYGPWSTGMTFSTPIPWPNAPTLISPNSSISSLRPTYNWNTVSSDTGVPASWYQLTVNGPNGTVLSQWFEASLVCSGGTCSARPSTPLGPGPTFTWWVRGWNLAGNGPWSNGMSFTLTSDGGFDSQFNGSSTGWINVGGTWVVGNNSWLTTPGVSPFSKSTRSEAAYANFVYTAKLKRTGCEWCDNSLYVRGTPFPTNSYGFWSSGYQFTYANDGYFAVWKAVNGSWSLLQDYTSTSAIIPYDWNTLRVIASGSNLYFYINGTLVWSGADGTFNSGVVGLAMDNLEDSVSPNDQIYVDWAVLSSYAEAMPVITETVSAEQQALNDAANANGSDKTYPDYRQP